MQKTVYTNYWVNERANVRKQHGSFETEEDAVAAILAWWEIHKESYKDVSYVRTNRGALEVLYGDPNYYYRIEERQVDKPLPTTKYKLRSPGEIEALRQRHQLDADTLVFDELPEPYRDRIIVAMGDSMQAREYTFTKDGKPITKALAKKKIR